MLDVASDHCLRSIQILDPQFYGEIVCDVKLHNINDALSDHLISMGLKTK